MTQTKTTQPLNSVVVSNTSTSTVTYETVEVHPFDLMTTEQVRDLMMPYVTRIQDCGYSLRSLERYAGLKIGSLSKMFEGPVTPETPKCDPVMAALIRVIAHKPWFMLENLRRLQTKQPLLLKRYTILKKNRP